MAINQPPITGNTVMDAWMLEVTRELNSGSGDIPAEAGALIENVDESGILRLNRGVLSNSDVVTDVTLDGTSVVSRGTAVLSSGMSGITNVDLVQDDYTFRIVDADPVNEINPPANRYAITDMNGDPVNIPTEHMVFIGGIRLCETPMNSIVNRDYRRSGNAITLRETTRDFIGLDLVITIFTARVT